MVKEELIVISFGVVLAVTSVALFWAHVRRINAPNKADPQGTLVEIKGLGAALGDDRAAAARRRSSGSGGKHAPAPLAKRWADGRNGEVRNINSRIAEGVGSDKATGCLGVNCTERQCSAAASGCAGSSAAVCGERQKGGRTDGVADAMVEEPPEISSALLLPSPLWADAILKHADTRRKTLKGMVRPGADGGGVAVGWEGIWDRLAPTRRRKLLESVREELVHAVSAYIGQDETLFSVLCPDLTVDALEREHRGVSGLSRLLRQCLEGKLSEPKSRAYATVQAALAKAATSAAENVPKNERGSVRSFLPTFRKLCSYSFCIAALEAVVRGRADGSAGPTLSSVLGALVRTGGSGCLVWVFFHGLHQMSADDYVSGEGSGNSAVAKTETSGGVGAPQVSQGAPIYSSEETRPFCHALKMSGLLVRNGNEQCDR